ncbi:Capsid proteins [uncultured Alphaproteobacteria bacterium]|uniref:Capsid proteins n=1 Tax=uncultured Alphaproteobacteria bacterium TaxID=91750 RepID=A0A212J490_9PROT|nr:Capsid proteins [uncultured Alphaproteobacteria bacterium]
MKNATRVLYAAYLKHLAEINGVASPEQKFAVSPTIEQTLEDRIQESAAFLSQVNVVGVDDQSAEVLGLGIGTPAAGRTDTKTKDRQPRAIHDMTGRTYTCKQTNFDTFITYNELDIWAKFKDFQTRIRDHIIRQIARDRLTIGFNGTSAAADTDLAANPLLQDVNVGWLQHIREDAPERVLSGLKVGTEAGADVRNLDALVQDAVGELLDPWYQDDSEIVAITGRTLLADKYLALTNSAATDAPTEKAALATLTANKTLGGKLAKSVPFFPAKSILITKASNLSIYYQNGTRRRFVKENPARDRVEDFQSVNEAYVVEDLGACAFLENILTWNGEAWV